MVHCHQKSRKALTLLELVVVLMILAALGGLVIPLVNVYREQSAEAGGVASLAEITALVELASVDPDNPGYPNNLDSLMSSGTVSNKLFNTGEFSTYSLDANQASVLSAHGISSVHDIDPAVSTNATFNATLAARGLAAAQSIVRVADAAVLRELKMTPGATGGVNNVFVAFGFGDQNSLIGSTLQEAPFSMPGTGSPNNVYSRYLLIIEIPGAGASGGDAQFIGTVFIGRNGIEGQQSLAEDYFNVQ